MEMSRTTDQTNDVGYIYVRTPTFDIMMVVTRQAGSQSEKLSKKRPRPMLMFVYHFLAINRLITICQVGRFFSLLFAFSKHNDRLSDGGWRSSGSSLNNAEEANCVLLTKGKITTTTIRSFSKVQPEVGMRPNCRREGM